MWPDKTVELPVHSHLFLRPHLVSDVSTDLGASKHSASSYDVRGVVWAIGGPYWGIRIASCADGSSIVGRPGQALSLAYDVIRAPILR